uniref:Insulin-like domain-containing protein n=1 Tax=Gadus morhua TaxID=8049 RepID=A0A8C5FI22_GADMO
MGRPQYFCGDHLVETLNQVCGDRGYNLTRVQCCHGNGCNIYDLQNYCH